MAHAKQTDVETSLMRELTPSESQYVVAMLDRAEALLKARIPDLEEKVAASADYLARVVAITAEAVARVFRNPAGYRQESEGNYSYSLNFQVASGLLDVLDNEWSRLGIGMLGSLAPTMDGYLATRGGGDDWVMSERVL